MTMITQTTPRNQYCFSFLIIIIVWFFLSYDTSVFIISFTILYKTSVIVVFQSLSCVQFLWPHGLEPSKLPCPSLSSRVCSEFLGGSMVKKKSACNAEDVRDMGSVPGLQRFPGEGNGHPLQYSFQGFHPWVREIPWERKWKPTPYLKNSMDRGAWQTIVHGLAKSWTRLSN